MILTHWGRDKMDAVFQAAFPNTFTSTKMLEFRLKFHWSFTESPLNNIPALIQIKTWHRPGDRPLSEPMMVILRTKICVTRLQWVNWRQHWLHMSQDVSNRFNTLWSSDAIWRKRTWSTSVQMMDCCLTAPSYYLNQHWLIISEILWHGPKGNMAGNVQTIYFYMSLKTTNLSLRHYASRANELIACV